MHLFAFVLERFLGGIGNKSQGRAGPLGIELFNLLLRLVDVS